MGTDVLIFVLIIAGTIAVVILGQHYVRGRRARLIQVLRRLDGNFVDVKYGSRSLRAASGVLNIEQIDTGFFAVGTSGSIALAEVRTVYYSNESWMF